MEEATSSIGRGELLYATPVWLEAVSLTSNARTTLRRPQRVAALMTIRAYRTASDEAAFVLSGMPPVDLIAKESVGIKARVSKDPLPGDSLPTRTMIKK